MSKYSGDYIQSTLDNEGKAILKETIPVNDLVVGYKKQFGIEVQHFFNGIKDIKIYECINTKYRFFYPFNIDGDGSFYQFLQKFDWYYMPWKWEHEMTKNTLNGHEKILEVGCGGLGFVDKMSKLGFDVTGLELNEDSVLKAKRNGFNVFNETIQEHSTGYFGKYDIVCSYQVVEHITNVKSFIQAQVDCLKKGGRLFISVPNNDSFIKYTKGGLLNFPPHHMGLWNTKSLTSLEALFNLKVEKVLFEPLQEYHFDWFVSSVFQKLVNKNKLVKLVFDRYTFKRLFRLFVRKNMSKIHGHSIMVIYKKV
jgi:2-polyprenyl-3-methyl-5-hydroxy-6-metoxy-1,4-benzoquinol methylase